MKAFPIHLKLFAQNLFELINNKNVRRKMHETNYDKARRDILFEPSIKIALMFVDEDENDL